MKRVFKRWGGKNSDKSDSKNKTTAKVSKPNLPSKSFNKEEKEKEDGDGSLVNQQEPTSPETVVMVTADDDDEDDDDDAAKQDEIVVIEEEETPAKDQNKDAEGEDENHHDEGEQENYVGSNLNERHRDEEEQGNVDHTKKKKENVDKTSVHDNCGEHNEDLIPQEQQGREQRQLQGDLVGGEMAINIAKGWGGAGSDGNDKKQEELDGAGLEHHNQAEALAQGAPAAPERDGQHEHKDSKSKEEQEETEAKEVVHSAADGWVAETQVVAKTSAPVDDEEGEDKQSDNGKLADEKGDSACFNNKTAPVSAEIVSKGANGDDEDNDGENPNDNGDHDDQQQLRDSEQNAGDDDSRNKKVERPGLVVLEESSTNITMSKDDDKEPANNFHDDITVPRTNSAIRDVDVSNNDEEGHDFEDLKLKELMVTGVEDVKDKGALEMENNQGNDDSSSLSGSQDDDDSDDDSDSGGDSACSGSEDDDDKNEEEDECDDNNRENEDRETTKEDTVGSEGPPGGTAVNAQPTSTANNNVKMSQSNPNRLSMPTQKKKKPKSAETIEMEAQALKSELVLQKCKWSQKNCKLPKLKYGTLYQHAVLGLRHVDTVVVLGGKQEDSSVKSVLYFDPSKHEWVEGPPLNRERRSLAAAESRQFLYAIGGSGRDTIERIHIAAFAAADQTKITQKYNWELLKCRLSAKREGCAAVVVRNRFLIVMGGSWLSSIDVIDTAATVLVVVAGPSMNIARRWFGAGVVGSDLWVVGGQDNEIEKRLNSIESIPLNPDNHTSTNGNSIFSPSSSWTVHNFKLANARYGHTVVSVGWCLVVAGGHNGVRALASVEVVDTRRHVVWRLPDLIVPRTGSTMVALSQQLVVLGGKSRDSVESLALFDRNENLKAVYQDALDQRVRPSPHQVRIMLCGPYGTGKTTCSRLLQDQGFDSKYRATKGIDINAGQIQRRIYPSNGTALEALSSWLGFSRFSNKNGQSTNLPLDNEIIAKEKEIDVVSRQSRTEQSHQRSKSTQESDRWHRPNQGKRTFSLWRKSQRQRGEKGTTTGSAKQTKNGSQSAKLANSEPPREIYLDYEEKQSFENITLSFWDFGGHVEFLTMQQTFFRDCCLYVLVLNLQRDDDRDTAKVASVDKMLRDAQLWLNAIVSSAGPHIALLLVGTHADYFDSKAAAESQLHWMLDQLKDRGSGTGLDLALKDVRTAVVDNKNGLCVDDFRSTMFDMTKSLFQAMKAKVPLRWLLLVEKIQEIGLESNELCVSRTAMMKVAKLVEQKEINKGSFSEALVFLEKMGKVALIHEKGMLDGVICQPNYLLALIESLLAPSMPGMKPKGFSQDQWSSYHQNGVLSNGALKSLWSGFGTFEPLRSVLVRSGIIMDLGDRIVIPFWLPGEKFSFADLPNDESASVRIEMTVDTICDSYLPFALFPYVLSDLHREFGNLDQPLELLGRISSVLRLNLKERFHPWLGSQDLQSCYLWLQADQLKRQMSLTIRGSCIDAKNARQELVSICVEVVSTLHKIARSRCTWLSLKSQVRTVKPCNGFTHKWFMLETTPEHGISKVCSSFPQPGSDIEKERTLLDTVVEVSQKSSNCQACLKALIKRSLWECELFHQANWGPLDCWNPEICDIATAEDQLVERTADLYSDLLHDQGGVAKLEGKNEGLHTKQKVELLGRAVKALEKVYRCVVAANPEERLGAAEWDVFLSHRAGKRMTTYLTYIQTLLKENYKCSAYLGHPRIAADVPNLEFVQPALTCHVGVVTLMRETFTSKQALRELGIFTARQQLNDSLEDSPTSSPKPTPFRLILDAFKKEAIKLTIPGTSGRLPTWDISHAVLREQKTDFDHAKELVGIIWTVKDMQDGKDKRCSSNVSPAPDPAFRPSTVLAAEASPNPAAEASPSPASGPPPISDADLSPASAAKPAPTSGSPPDTSAASSPAPSSSGILVRLQNLEKCLGSMDSRNIFERIPFLEQVCGLNGDSFGIGDRVSQLEHFLVRVRLVERALMGEINDNSSIYDKIASFEECFGLGGEGSKLVDRVAALEEQLKNEKLS